LRRSRPLHVIWKERLSVGPSSSIIMTSAPCFRHIKSIPRFGSLFIFVLFIGPTAFSWCRRNPASQLKSRRGLKDQSVAGGILWILIVLPKILRFSAKPLIEFGYPRHVGFGFDARIGHQHIFYRAFACPIYESWNAFFAADRELMAAGRLSLFDQKKLGAVYGAGKLVFWFHLFFSFCWAKPSPS